jgi:4-alpha-glucanotransferase
MTHKNLVSEIALLGRLCGITAGFQDNQGKRHRTSQATYKALLTAMGVPWENPEARRLQIETRQARAADRLLNPVSLVGVDWPLRALLAAIRTREAAPIRDLPGAAEITGENAATWTWEGCLDSPDHLIAFPVAGGFRVYIIIPLPPDLEPGYYNLKLRVGSGQEAEAAETFLILHPFAAYQPPCLAGEQRLWGFNLPLYALTAPRNWGIGDFTDLQDMMSWAGDLGAAFVGVNPLHAPTPRAQSDISPYSPNSRLFLNFLYLDLEKVPELADSPQAQALLASPEFQDARERLRFTPLVTYSEVFQMKRQVLGLLFETFCELHGGEPPRTARGREFARFAAGADELLDKFAVFSALVEHWGHGDWRLWPPAYRLPHGPDVARFAREHPGAALFHKYVQWLAAGQLRMVKEQAQSSGLPFTLYQDLALGTVAGGFESWAYPGLFAQGTAIGAPPDAFNPKGQDWGLPPMIPERLQELRFQPFIQTLRANLPEDGMLRLDHVMALFRLFWIPHTENKAAGAYVLYPDRELLAILALESQRRRTLIIGEDLGTVASRIRRDLHKRNIFSYRVFYFERNPEGGFQEPEAYPRQALATVTTHDLPTLAGFWQSRDIELKRSLDLYPGEQMAAEDVRSREEDKENLLHALSRHRLLPQAFSAPGAGQACPEEVRLGVLEYLAQSPAALVEIRLEDVFGLTEQQNLPGTTNEYPNWKGKIPLSLSRMQEAAEPRRLAARMARCSRKSGAGGKKTDE